ncbi:MAG: peptidase M28 [Sphingobacteriia bacterium 24-36-13]|jgi:Zn-dependent M28 family amino/carboxypeptidase|uniref:M28 family metallopeptidase n=1 Tax=Sediminibacterium sp. TaxID=1917865 RepID=UPI000BC614C4|nr:M28 family metallopeptidase [Sediminibacterium sp.]OYY08174.1 MAG: peptidase M28 [Sphingobacteriia bacterium 35-36-14]OYZ52419.1 MAG: peptidase M28 [Sphingobacteriia bacterium 24-36-13]OZA62923.1 MAG: peptidase M28 [Sphingobacteriia bacterium 39-36-14]HQS25464.1 M28 family metallopeptidase [Sediminibacterium sp.]HQS35823.1 M28 family metallopeptidase [Sediminibacterium sp.]
MYKIFKTVLAIPFIIACSSQSNKFNEEDGLSVFNVDSLKKHISVLASDDFMGRKPFTEGETKTVAYLQEQFKQMGLEPGNGDSYIQEVPMANILATAAPNMQVKSAKGNFNLKAFDDYIIWTDKTDSSISLDNAELVFAGYGVVAPEYNWNDYAGLDVKGKVVMVMVNDPGFWVGDTTLFKGKAMTYYGRWTYKFEEAARQGAKGCLIIHNTAAASYPFSVQQNSFNTTRLKLDNRGKNIPNCDVIGWVPEKISHQLFAAAGFDSSLLVKANQPGFKAVPLGLQLSTTMNVKASFNKSSNVVAKITGTKRPDEVIIYTAHWDHLGIGRPDKSGDSIYNGALDNASGTAGLLEMARVFKNMKVKPERTIVFLAVTAEEQGLLGSAYYAENPIYSVKKTVANINMDGLNRFGKTKDMVVVGQGQSELEDYLKEAIEKTGGYLSFDTHTEAGYYYRSDHFNFAKVGIPALFANNGVDVVGKGKEYGETLENEYTSKNYHQASDNYDAATWTGDGAINDLKLLFTIGRRMGFETSFPKWKEGSEFKLIREKSNK